MPRDPQPASATDRRSGAWDRWPRQALIVGALACALSAPPARSGCDVVAIAASADHALVLTDDGSVWAWGCNTSGQLGNGTILSGPTWGVAVPAPVLGIGDVVAIDAGDGFSLALRVDGSLWAWGRNDQPFQGVTT